MAVGVAPDAGVEGVRVGEAGVSGSSVALSELGRSVGAAAARPEDGPSVDSSEPPQASTSNGISSARVKRPRKRRGVLISIDPLCLWS